MKIILTGGGTAGHVSPALAVAEELLAEDANTNILFIGRHGGAENDAVIKSNIKLETLKIQGIKRKISSDNIKSVYYALRVLTN